MLIEALAEMAFKAGAERISIEIRPETESKGSVLIIHSFGIGMLKDDDLKGKSTLAALAAPIVVGGTFGDMDDRIVALLDAVGDDIETASAGLPETTVRSMREKLRQIDKTAKQESDEGAESKPEGQDAMSVGNESKVDEFASGEAESL